MKRSHFLRMMALTAGGMMLGMRCTTPAKKIPGRLLGAGSAVGHLLRDGNFTRVEKPEQIIETQVLVVGGGISGLSAMRTLQKNNISEILLLELDEHFGGNAASGKNDVSAYPWGAHYLPVPSGEFSELVDFLRETNILLRFDAEGRAIFDEEMICFDPKERLYLNNQWQDDLVPAFAIPEAEQKEIDRFFSIMEAYRQEKGSDGKFAFAIPVDFSSTDEKFRALDQLTMKVWMEQQSLHSAHLHWYVNYSCRDDYGAGYADVSAWAGIHYFASRRHMPSNAADDAVLTWPEGNGRLVSLLLDKAHEHLRKKNALVYKAGRSGDGVYALYYDVATKKTVRVEAEKIILAVPQFVASRLLKNFPGTPDLKGFSYSPWMIANLTVNNWPVEHGRPLSWDNVIYGSENIGYVDACHQHLAQHEPRRVLTYYHPLDHLPPAEARKEASSRTHEEWTKQIVEQLSVAHLHPEAAIENIDVWLWGHGMIRPAVGFITGEDRRRSKLPLEPGIHFAHSDRSGISIFEEAFYQGHRAALEVVAALEQTA